MEDKAIQILLIEDVTKFAGSIRQMLEEAPGDGFEFHWVETLDDGLASLRRSPPDTLLLDLSLAGCDGLDSYRRARAVAPHCPIIVLSTINDETLALQAVHEGAQDYLVKGQIDSPLLVRAIRYALERGTVELALHRAQEKYRSIFENIVEGIFQTTVDGHYINANPALARIYGYDTPAELISHLTDISRELYVEPGRRDDFIRVMDKFDIVRDFESRIYRRDRSIIWIAENVRCVRDRAGRVLYYEGTVEDITERKLTEERLRNSETLYHSLVENLPQNILRKDLQERFTFANQRFCKTLGLPLEEILGKTDFDFFPPELAAKYQQDDRRIMETGEPFETVEENRPPGGGRIFVNVAKTPLRDASGNIIGLQGIFWDITEKILAEERARKATEELARSREELRAKNEQMEDDLRMAREIQQAIIPQQYPSFPRWATASESVLKFCHRYLPTGEVGGDFFNVRALSDTKAGVFICDVMGHGVRSALVTAIVRALVEELTPLSMDPGQLLSQVNRDLRAILKQSGSPLFTTAFYMVVDVTTHEMVYANAGHPKPLLLRRSTGAVTPLQNRTGKSNPALCLFEEFAYTTSTAQLAADDLVVLFTDGLYDVEGPEGEPLSVDWVRQQVEERRALPVAAMFDELIALLKKLSGSAELLDDVCVVGMEVGGNIPHDLHRDH